MALPGRKSALSGRTRRPGKTEASRPQTEKPEGNFTRGFFCVSPDCSLSALMIFWEGCSSSVSSGLSLKAIVFQHYWPIC